MVIGQSDQLNNLNHRDKCYVILETLLKQPRLDTIVLKGS